MSQTRAFYSIIQYVPDTGRAEAANVGVVLLVPSERRIEVRTSPTLNRVRRFFAPGKSQLQRVQLALEALKNRLCLGTDEFADETAFAQFVAARADLVRLTVPRLALISSPLNDLNELYCELVGDVESAQQLADAMEILPARIAEVLGRLEVDHKVWRPGAIEIPKSRRKFDVSFAYRNGLVNYVRTESLVGHAKLDSRLEKLGFNGQLLHEHPLHGQRQMLVVMSSDPAASREVEDRFASTLTEFHVRFIPYRLADDFATEIEQSAH
jgi:hypothetical protein